MEKRPCRSDYALNSASPKVAAARFPSRRRDNDCRLSIPHNIGTTKSDMRSGACKSAGRSLRERRTIRVIVVLRSAVFLRVCTGRVRIGGFSPVRDGSVVTKAAASGGFRTVRVGKWNGARTALAAKTRPAALRHIGLRPIGSRTAVAPILSMRRLQPEGRGQNTQACENAESALHLDLPVAQ